MPTQDPLDDRILALLREDARITNAALAAAVGLSQSACLRRVRRLEERGVIRGYTVLVDEPAPAGRSIVLVQISLERQSDEYLRRFEEAVRRVPEVRDCLLMAGDPDYVLRVETGGPAEYERLHKERLSRLPGVARLRSSFAIRAVIGGGHP
ncbi:MAG: Lrp/AsnC family transcriptional regulator [Acetobacteraceae bacterium]|nr:Lrp/AsnC family transcriptional regulator [Acetobacteraceae bacterium]MDW8397185.1 Lrp/AsnC family transcriptional regulator [Acetobacteraceae bacterium]